LRFSGGVGADGGGPRCARYAHIVVIVEENKDYAQILSPSAAPNISALAAQYGDATQFFGEVHPSEANYVALLGGDTFGFTTMTPSTAAPGWSTPPAQGPPRQATPTTP